MSGLIKKELILLLKKLKSSGKVPIVVLGALFLLILSSGSGGILILNVLLPVFLVSYAATNTQEDEVAKWDFFLRTFPLSSRQVVISRYLTFGLLVLISTIFMLLMSIISFTLFDDYSFGLYLIFLGVGFILSLISLSILIPVNFHSGSKGSITVMIGAGFLLSAFPTLAEAGIIDPFAWEITGEMFAVLLVIFTIILAVASLGISIFIYSRKEF